MYWKCEDKNCKGRGNSCGEMLPPLKLTKAHNLWHEPSLVKREVYETIRDYRLASTSIKSKGKNRQILKDILKDKSDDVLAELPTASALAQQGNRINKRGQTRSKEPKKLKDLVIDNCLKKTYKGEEFFMGESGEDNERVFLFSTTKNLKLLSKYTAWMGDGTFAVLPLIFLQLYTILVIVNNFPLPLAFGLLPNKKTKTYIAFFSLIYPFLTSTPTSINVDFELACFTAVKKVFGNSIQIYGCYFHLSQSFFRNVQLKGLIKEYKLNKNFQFCFNLCQAVSFLRIEDVKRGFGLIKSHVRNHCAKFSVIITYIEIYYVGKGVQGVPRFPISSWNLHQRVLLGFPRTSNKLERFNKEFNLDCGDYHQATFDIIENLRLEQGQTENTIVKIKLGEKKPQNQLQIDFDSAIMTILNNYDMNDLFDVLSNLAMCIGKHKHIINKSKKGRKKKPMSSDSDDN